MKTLAALMVLFPGAALAHGDHPPMEVSAAHGLAHIDPMTVAFLAALAIAAMVWQRWSS